MNDEIIVSVCCITYNQERYIKKCLDGMLMQQTSFRFEILVHDDASTDNTQNIIKNYTSKYPELIKPIIQVENQYSKGLAGKMNARFNFPRAKGKYIAMCEGDDYWTDPLKLQKQVDFLEKNSDCSICFHATYFKNNLNSDTSYIHRPKKYKKNIRYTIRDAILGGGGFMATNSMVFSKNCIIDIPHWVGRSPVGDLPLMLLISSYGNIGYIDEVMGVYNQMVDNSFSSSIVKFHYKIKDHHYKTLELWNNFNKWSNYKYNSLVQKKKLFKWYIYLKYLVKYYIGF